MKFIDITLKNRKYPYNVHFIITLVRKETHFLELYNKILQIIKRGETFEGFRERNRKMLTNNACYPIDKFIEDSL